MTKGETVVASAGVCAGLIGAGLALGRLTGRPAAATGVAMSIAAAYLTGTYSQNSALFGRVKRPRSRSAGRAVSLTFDDGPDPRHTVAISALLAERGHRGTFFVLGSAVHRHPAIVRRLAVDGHEIACHGDDHRLLGFARPGTIIEQLDAWEQAVETALGRPGTRLFRAPHGVRSPWLVAVARRHGYAVCGWNGSVFDTALPGVATIACRAAALLRPGAVVLLHDGDGSGRGGSRAQTVAALGPLLDAMERKELCSIPLGTLLCAGAHEKRSLRVPRGTAIG